MSGFSYSGRGMFGRQCLAFDSLSQLLEAIREDRTLPTDGWQTDALGLDTVYYNAGCQAPKDEDETDDDETEYQQQPEQCATCGSRQLLAYCTADVNGRMAHGWMCDGCGHFHTHEWL